MATILFEIDRVHKMDNKIKISYINNCLQEVQNGALMVISNDLKRKEMSNEASEKTLKMWRDCVIAAGNKQL